MESRSVQARIDDIVTAIAGIQETLKGMTFAEYEQSWQARHATERGLEIISEASRALPSTLKQQAPEIAWSRIAGIGNILRHEYQRVEPLLVWNITQEHLDPLAHALKRISNAAG